MAKQWYHSWFNSPYYHILYHHRNDEEAQFFIDNLCQFIQLPAQARILDIACGRGRHAAYLNKKGYDVTGIDLSSASIQFASQFENEHLHFFVHDMRQLFYINYFDIAVNLFTSFGYFDSDKEHVKALKSFNRSLKKDGLFVLDYMNSYKIAQQLVSRETKEVEGIQFNITRRIEDGHIIKTIDFVDKQKHFSFQEKVKAFLVEDFERMFAGSSFTILHTFGDYALSSFDKSESDRLIFICKKHHA